MHLEIIKCIISHEGKKSKWILDPTWMSPGSQVREGMRDALKEGPAPNQLSCICPCC